MLDIGLPDTDGCALAKQLRKEPQTASALLIALTGFSQKGDRRRSRAAGIDHHLVKPVDSAKLLELIAQSSAQASASAAQSPEQN